MTYPQSCFLYPKPEIVASNLSSTSTKVLPVSSRLLSPSVIFRWILSQHSRIDCNAVDTLKSVLCISAMVAFGRSRIAVMQEESGLLMKRDYYIQPR